MAVWTVHGMRTVLLRHVMKNVHASTSGTCVKEEAESLPYRHIRPGTIKWFRKVYVIY